MNAHKGMQQWATFFLFTISVLICLVFLETTVRLAKPYPIPPDPVVPEPESVEMFEEYKPYGYRLRPGRTFIKTIVVKGAQGKSKITHRVSNRDGFRGRREFDESDPRPRIMVLGDSFTFGWGVEEDRRFSDLLEQKSPRWRVDNLGMNGFGPDLMLQALEEVGLKVKPNIVLFCLYTDSMKRVQPYFAGYGYELNRFDLEAGQLVKVPYPRRHEWDHLHTVWWFRKIFREITQWEWRLHDALLGRLIELSRKHGFKPVIVFFSGYWPDREIDRRRRQFLKSYSLKHDIPWVDLTSSIHAVGYRKAFILGDQHWNELGHSIAAEQLHRFLNDGGLLDLEK